MGMKILWQKLLFEIYQMYPVECGDEWRKSLSSDDHPLAKKLRMNGQQIKDCLTFLKSQKLIKIYKYDFPDLNNNPLGTYRLITPAITEKGFSVVLGLIKHNDSQKIQIGLFIFAGMTVLTGAMKFINEIYEICPEIMLAIYGISIFVIGMISICIAKKF